MYGKLRVDGQPNKLAVHFYDGNSALISRTTATLPFEAMIPVADDGYEAKLALGLHCQ